MSNIPSKSGPPQSGLRDWIKSRTSIKGEAWKFAEVFFSSFVVAGPLTRVPGVETIIKRLALMTDKHPSAGFSIPFNVDLADRGEKVTLPVDLAKQAIREASFRALINKCACRHTFDCKAYPHEFGCMFLGAGARVVVENGIAHEATVEECLAHVDKAAALGLAAGAFWVEVEQYVWGFKDKDRERHLELCFCCSCCCGAFKFEKSAKGRTKHILHKSMGWRCTVGESCTQCGACIEKCPRLLISRGTSRVVIDDECAGCGMCLEACKSGALRVVQVESMRDKLTDYFDGLQLKL